MASTLTKSQLHCSVVGGSAVSAAQPPRSKGGVLASEKRKIVWLLLNIIIFVVTYFKYQRPQYRHVYEMLGAGLCVSRGSAAVITLSCGLVLLPMCRGLNSLGFSILGRISRYLLARWLASLKQVHVTVATTILVASVVHSVAHMVNAVNFSRHHNSRYPEINWAIFKGQSPLVLVLSSSAGLTGLVMLLLLILMVLMSLSRVREHHFHLFWATHFLFLPFMGCLLLHPLSGILKEQSNYFSWNCSFNSTSSESQESQNMLDCHEPVFVAMKCQGWLFVAAALTVYTADCAVRLFHRNKSVFKVAQVVNLPGGVTQLTLTTRGIFQAKPGQYILLQCPSLSSLEWHPFTITKTQRSSSNSCITVLIRRRGNWTKTLSRTVSNFGSDKIIPLVHKPPRLLVDGPFSSPMDGILRSRVAVCVAAGIGITPFMSVLEYLNKADQVQWLRPSRLHLVWVVRTLDQLTWAAELITQLHHKLWFANQPDRFYVAFFVTRDYTTQDLKHFNPLTFNLLEKRINHGRPVWKQLFKEWTTLYSKRKVPVFVCGPRSLSKQVESTARKVNKKGYNFTCIKEIFS